MKTVSIYDIEDAENLASILLKNQVPFSVEFQEDGVTGTEYYLFTVEGETE